ncbi:conserved hypothetical protein [Magnetospirillum sp. UT-4]|nr:conserved hypothetical protein [Magnetospirillum sp. UT-4]
MPSIDFSHLSRQERIDLIGDLCESLDDAAVTVTPAQKDEIDRRVASLDEDAGHARGVDEVVSLLRRRYR